MRQFPKLPRWALSKPLTGTAKRFVDLNAGFKNNLQMYKLDLTLHSLPDSLNKGLRAHRFAYQQKNKRWDMLIIGMVRNKLPLKPLTKARVTIVRHSWRWLDYDGLVGSMKPIVDALVDAGVMEDDSYTVTGPWHVTQEFRPKKSGPLLTVCVEEVPE